MRLGLIFALVASSSVVEAKTYSDWDAYMHANRYKCPGPFDTLEKPQSLTLAGKPYRHKGYTLEVQTNDGDAEVKIGVVSAIKDVTANTKANLKDAFDWFKAENVEWVVANGDLALDELDLEEVIELLGQSGLPVIIVLGNSESRGSWARAYNDRAKTYPNLVNGTWVRQIIADDVEFWTMPGYHDKQFVRQGAGCTYEKKHVDEVVQVLKAKGDRQVVLISHGPPRGDTKDSLDFIAEKKNVGDPLLNTLLSKAAIRFGIFGHILEAGGRAVDGDLKTPIPQKTMASSLMLNAGSLSADPWKMLDGTTSWGLASLITLNGAQASYEVKRFPQR